MNVDEIKSLIQPVLESLGIDLVDLFIFGKGNRTGVRVLVDEMGGITLSRITQASRAVADILDQKDVWPSRYTLEVSSPGVDRPLKTERDFARHIGRTIKVLYVGQEAVETYLGKILAVTAESVTLQGQEAEKTLAIHKIKSALIQLEF